MPRINLLPWREQQRKTRRREFWVASGGAAVAALIVAGGGKLLYTSWTDAQIEKNNLLKMEIVEKLQRKRPEIVHQFDELVHTVPDGVYLTSLKQSGNKLEIHGIAQSSTRVSTFMRNIDGSSWFDNPQLQVVETAKDAPNGGSNFVLFANTVGVNLDEGGETTVKRVAAK